VARGLLASGQKVHARVRDPTSAAAQQLAAVDAHLFQADFSSPAAIASAELTHAQTIISVCRASGVTKCVYSSVVNAGKAVRIQDVEPTRPRTAR
jgi:uncharacterized protein YbjT (DUF2867 family)